MNALNGYNKTSAAAPSNAPAGAKYMPLPPVRVALDADAEPEEEDPEEPDSSAESMPAAAATREYQGRFVA